MNRNVLAVVVGAGLVSVTGQASAQEALAVEGAGYPVGEGTVIHPGVGAEVGFTDNVFYQDDDNTPAGLFRLIASFSLASKEIEPEEVDPLLIEGEDDVPAEPAHPKLAYTAGGNLRFEQYLAGEDAVLSQRYLGADLRGHLEVMPKGKVSFIADEAFVRDTRPTNFESSNNNNQIANTLSLALRFQPGGGTMNGQLRWENYLNVFQDAAFANRMINTIHGRYEWRLFPYTKLFADVSYGFITGLGDNELGGMPYKRDANPIRGGVGIATVITEVFTVKAHAGWNYASYAGGASYNAPMFGGEAGYRYSPVGRFVASYTYEHRDSINADFYRDHALRGGVDHQFDRLLLTGVGELRLRHYEGISPAIGAPTREDLIFAVGARGQYILKDTFAIVADWRTEVDQTDYMYSTGTGFDDPSFVRTEITAGVRAAF